MASLSGLATDMLPRFKSLGEALLCNAVFNAPDLFKQDKDVLEVNNMVHDTAIQFSNEKRLHKQCKRVHINTNRILRLIDLGFDITIPKDFEMTSLHHASYRGAPIEVISALLSTARGQKASMRTDRWGRIPLHYACQMGASVEVIKALLNAAPKGVRMADEGDGFPLHYACANRASLEVIKSLLNAAPEVARTRTVMRKTPLHYACEMGASVEVIKALLNAAPEVISVADRNGKIPLYWACERNASKEVIDALLSEPKKL
jgi:ankyrin repeat protein